MSTVVQRYAAQCLAGSGIAVMASPIAWQLRPDLWGSAQDCALSAGWRMVLPGTQAMEADIEGMGPVRVLVRSQDRLMERIGWIVGATVRTVRQAADEAAPRPMATPLQTDAQRRAVEEQEQLLKLAAMQPPAHDCPQRREILKARQTLGTQ